MSKILVIKHIDIEGPGSIGDFFMDAGWELEVVELGYRQELPNTLRGIGGIISLGGPMNVYETGTYPFIKAEEALLRRALEEEVPILGVCFGAQLLAKVLGAEVRKAPSPERGWSSIMFTAEGRNNPLFTGLAGGLEVFQWHEDTFDIPSGGTLLASSSVCLHQAFVWGTNAHGLQFHIEVTPEMIESWVSAYGPDAKRKDNTLSAMVTEAYQKKEMAQKKSRILSGNFARIMTASRKITAG